MFSDLALSLCILEFLCSDTKDVDIPPPPNLTLRQHNLRVFTHHCLESIRNLSFRSNAWELAGLHRGKFDWGGAVTK